MKQEKKQKKILREEGEVKKSKKRAKILIFSALAAMIVLIVLNSIDYDKLADKIVGDSDSQKQELVTYPEHYFEEPIYDENVLEDEQYVGLDRYVYLKIGNEINQLSGSSYEDGTMEDFWIDYFNAVVGADSDALNSLHTDYFFKQNGKYGKFAPQKVYNIKVDIINARRIEEGEYTGAYQYFAKVNYNIYENNGTFRNDLKSDESREQIFELIEDRSGIIINSVSYPTEKLPTDNDSGFSLMPFVWIVLVILAVVIEMMSGALIAIWFMPAGIVALILSIMKVGVVAQIAAYVIITALLIVLYKTVFKKKIFANKEDENKEIGMVATVSQRIDPTEQTGEVRVNGRIWDARMTDGGCAEVDECVTVVRIEGDTVYCERQKAK